MLYLTTRNEQDTYTALRTLAEDRGPDGGLFMPFMLPAFSPEEIDGLKNRSFGDGMAQILNRFFSARLNGWDVEFTIGRAPVKLRSMSHRIAIAELWHNPDQAFGRMVRCLSARIQGREDTPDTATDWAVMAVRIGALFGIFAELGREGLWDREHPLDVAVPTGDFSAPMSAWYARELGLPVGTIICGCSGTSAPWDLLHHGEFRVDSYRSRSGARQNLDSLERLLCCRLGWEEAARYRHICDCGGIYGPGEEQFQTLREGFFAAVISKKRMESIIPNVYKTSGALLGPESALAYGGLQDYRAITGESRPALILTEKSPACDAETVCSALGIPEDQLEKTLSRT